MEREIMLTSHETFLHELNTAQILEILGNGQWKTSSQTITSAETNDNNLSTPDENWPQSENTAGVNAFHDIQFDKNVKRVLDVGGGKFDCNRDYLKTARNITLHVWDPYNRSTTHNLQVEHEIANSKVDAATSMSVLNVIPEVNVRLAHIVTVWKALNINGKAYFKIWPGEGILKGTYLPASTATSYQANAFFDRFIREIQIVFGINCVTIDKNIPNLIVATKKSDFHLSPKTIRRIKEISLNERKMLAKKQENSMDKIHRLEFSIAITNFCLFKKVIKAKNNDHQLNNKTIQLTHF